MLNARTGAKHSTLIIIPLIEKYPKGKVLWALQSCHWLLREKDKQKMKTPPCPACRWG